MRADLKLRFLKVLVNVPVRVLDRLLPELEIPEHPQTLLLRAIYSRLMKAYAVEVQRGTFREANAASDGNFERLLRVSLKILGRISEGDRCYRWYLGLALLSVREEIERFDPSPGELRRFLAQQDMPLDFLTDEQLTYGKEDFVEQVLCNYLHNLAPAEVNSRDE